MAPQEESKQKEKDGWGEDKVYTVIANVTKNSKIVLSTLNGAEIYPGQTVDLRAMFRKAQVQEATHEIASLIRSGHLRDMGEGADQRDAQAPAGGMPTQQEMEKKKQESMLREISDSTNLSFLEDQIKNKDPEVSKAARLRTETLFGMRDPDGNIIPGREEETAEPTKFIRESTGQAATADASVPGVVRRVQ